jgi:hypothetical protein
MQCASYGGIKGSARRHHGRPRQLCERELAQRIESCHELLGAPRRGQRQRAVAEGHAGAREPEPGEVGTGLSQDLGRLRGFALVQQHGADRDLDLAARNRILLEARQRQVVAQYFAGELVMPQRRMAQRQPLGDVDHPARYEERALPVAGARLLEQRNGLVVLPHQAQRVADVVPQPVQVERRLGDRSGEDPLVLPELLERLLGLAGVQARKREQAARRHRGRVLVAVQLLELFERLLGLRPRLQQLAAEGVDLRQLPLRGRPGIGAPLPRRLGLFVLLRLVRELLALLIERRDRPLLQLQHRWLPVLACMEPAADEPAPQARQFRRVLAFTFEPVHDLALRRERFADPAHLESRDRAVEARQPEFFFAPGAAPLPVGDDLVLHSQRILESLGPRQRAGVRTAQALEVREVHGVLFVHSRRGVEPQRSAIDVGFEREVADRASEHCATSAEAADLLLLLGVRNRFQCLQHGAQPRLHLGHVARRLIPVAPSCLQRLAGIGKRRDRTLSRR